MDCAIQTKGLKTISHEYSENILVQESVGNLLRVELDWDVVFAYNQEVLGQNGTLGRISYKEVEFNI
ncbi:MAG: hypothetical protein HDS84_04395 [Bacteroidales bacterium]|nr:hypothetical protein [Bacteroidales bacterium]